MPKFQMKIEPDVEPGEISKDVALALELAELPPIDDLKDGKAIKERIMWYFDFCYQHDERPCIHGLCLCLGVVRQTLINWESEVSERGKAVKMAKAIIRYQLEKWSVSGKLNPATAIFWSKNLLGMHDSVTIETAASVETMQELSPEEIKRRIDSDIPVDLIETDDTDSLPTAKVFDLDPERKEVLHGGI